jgi:transcription antitermination factor NusG
MQLGELRPQAGNAIGAPNWHAIFTRHQHEKTVASSLSKKNYEVYLPLYHSLRQWQDRAKFLWLPLFPCYVFVRGGMDRPLQILTTPGVVQIVKWGGHPAIVPETQMDAVRQILESGLTVESHPYLQVGDRVRVKAGPLTGLEGILARRKGAARLVVSMEILSRSAAVEIEEWNVERIGPLPSLHARSRLAVSA